MDRSKTLGRAPALALRRAAAANDEEIEMAHTEMKVIMEIMIAKMTTGPDPVVGAVRGEETREKMVAAVCRRPMILRTARKRRVLEILQRVYRK